MRPAGNDRPAPSRRCAWPYTRRPAHRRGHAPAGAGGDGRSTGKPLPAQNGAPLRLAVPWKYGFKSAKAIVAHPAGRARQPVSSWMQAAQLGVRLLRQRQPRGARTRAGRSAAKCASAKWPSAPTLPFNGYAERGGRALRRDGPAPGTSDAASASGRNLALAGQASTLAGCALSIVRAVPDARRCGWRGEWLYGGAGHQPAESAAALHGRAGR